MGVAEWGPHGSGECMGEEEWRMYWVHWNTRNARLVRKSLADNKPATGRTRNPVRSGGGREREGDRGEERERGINRGEVRRREGGRGGEVEGDHQERRIKREFGIFFIISILHNIYVLIYI